MIFYPLSSAMVGDVNMYMNDPEDPLFGEIEIMIAEPKRYLLIYYSYYSIDVQYLVFPSYIL